MKNTKDFKIYVKIEKWNYSEFFDAKDSLRIFFTKKQILDISGISKKQLDLYLFRHPEILREKHDGEVMISISVLYYVIKNFKRCKNKINKSSSLKD